MAERNNAKNIIIIILLVLLVLSLGFIAFERVQAGKQQQLQQTFRNGYQQGIIDSVSLIFQQTNNCQATNILVNNQTRQIIDVACIR